METKHHQPNHCQRLLPHSVRKASIALLPDCLPSRNSVSINGNEISKPHALFRIAEIKEKREDYTTADSLYLRIADEFPESYMADDALMKAALLEDQRLKAKETAKAHYERLINDYPTSLYTAQAKKNYRKL